jgi:hypothetical protein
MIVVVVNADTDVVCGNVDVVSCGVAVVVAVSDFAGLIVTKFIVRPRTIATIVRTIKEM